jgi:hypothetical protein
MTRARTEERKQFLADIITTAVEGGTGYWAQVSQYQYGDYSGIFDGKLSVYTGKRQGDDTRATLHEMNDDETGYKDEGLDLDFDAVARGLGKIKRGEIGINDRLRAMIMVADAENDAGNIDADAADVIAQVALLGEIVYG